MAGTKPRIGPIIDVALGDILLRFPRDGRLVLYFLVTVLAFWVLYVLQFYVQMQLVAGILAKPLANAAPDIQNAALFNYLSSLVGSVTSSAVVTPLAIAVHRKVLLKESPSSNVLESFGRSRGKSFFMAAFLIALINVAASVIPALVGLLLGSSIVVALLGAIGAIAAAIFAIRASLAFPTIAIDRPGSWIANGFALSRGCAWRIFWMLAVVTAAIEIPVGCLLLVGFVVFGVSLMGLVHAPGTDPTAMLARATWSPAFLLMPLIMSAAFALLIAAWAAALSHFYRAVAGDQAPPATA